MIEYIKGEISDLTPTYCVLETNGIGYMLNVSLVTYQELQGQTSARLYVYENIREDAHVLYGFLTKAERELFLLLISVSGVGAATARMILSSFTVAELQEIIAAGNVNAIKSVKGIGLKSAQSLHRSTNKEGQICRKIILTEFTLGVFCGQSAQY